MPVTMSATHLPCHISRRQNKQYQLGSGMSGFEGLLPLFLPRAYRSSIELTRITQSVIHTLLPPSAVLGLQSYISLPLHIHLVILPNNVPLSKAQTLLLKFLGLRACRTCRNRKARMTCRKQHPPPPRLPLPIYPQDNVIMVDVPKAILSIKRGNGPWEDYDNQFQLIEGRMMTRVRPPLLHTMWLFPGWSSDRLTS